MTKEHRANIDARIAQIDKAIRKHKILASWGNVESKDRLKQLRAHKRELKYFIKMDKG